MKLKFRRRRWDDNDHFFGPFTFARDTRWKPLGIHLQSTDDEDRGCSLRISGFGFTIIVALPNWVLRPERKKVTPTSWDAATIARLGRDWYWSITEREFGISYNEGFLQVMFGRVTHDSSTEQRWGYFLPWTQWRHVRHSLYNLDGVFFADIPHYRFMDPSYEEVRKIEEACPTISFAFADFDGELLTAKTKIEEREWRFGTGWFKWLSIFRRPKIRRSLDIRFSGETGERKGSWKGGTIGHSIKMREGELHMVAFMRYCDEHKMKFIGVV